MTAPTCFKISSSSTSAFKACPTRFRLGYREGLRVVQDTDSQRTGTNWHALHETYHNAVCGGSDGDQATEAAIDHLNDRYAEKELPTYKTPEEWEIERQILMASFMGYLWHWGDDPIEPLASEIGFDLPLHAPRTGLPLPLNRVVRVGKIDHIGVWRGMVVNVERKSTARSIDADSDYWSKAKKDTQVSMYALAFQDMVRGGELPENIQNHPAFTPDRFGNTLYDVWHKPTIKPCKLTQATTTALIETGEYCGREFAVEHEAGEQDVPIVRVEGIAAEVLPGKKGFAVRETPEMFAARLLEDIQARPEFYYARREIARTDQEIQQFRAELFNIYQAQRLYDDNGCWFENEQQCRATFPCQYLPICYGPGADAVCDSGDTPPGFRRIYTDLTVSRDNPNESE